MTEAAQFDGVSPNERIIRFLRTSQLAPEDADIVSLTADASDRRYVRVFDGDRGSLVLALHATPIDFAALPFVNVAELLSEMGAPAPRILGHSDADGIIALTDLGDDTLQAHLTRTGGNDRLPLYREAVELIELLQRRGRDVADGRFVPYRIAFDVDKLTWELEFFQRHFLEGQRGVTLRDSARAALKTAFADIVNELANEPRVLCHRDYHSRNLMLHRGRLYLIDFQDARLGPDTYDLASLLRDSYVELPDAEVEALIAHFVALTRTPDAGEFRRRFDLMSLQRNLKALGTFGYQAAARKNPVYLQYVPRTLGYVRENLGKYARFAALHRVLADVVPELA